MRFIKQLFSFLIFVALLMVGSYWYIRKDVDNTIGNSIYTVEDVPYNKTTMVLGAQVLPNLVPSQALENRLSTTMELYNNHKTEQLLMSGDGRTKYYNEVITMKEYARDAGVPEESILIDDQGLRTYESCKRAKQEFNIEAMTVVSQPNHVVRAVYLCRSLGIDVIGVQAPEFLEWQPKNKKYWNYKVREWAALMLAWYTVKTS